MKRRKTAREMAAMDVAHDEVDDKLEELDERLAKAPELSDKEREAVRERARAHVAKKAKERLTDDLFAKEVRRAEIEFAHPDEELMEITIDLPDFAYHIALDNVGYYHGLTYDVPRRKYLSMTDLMARAWEHDREIHARRRKGDIVRDPFNKGMNQQRNTSFSMSTGQVTRTDSLRQPLGR